MWRKSMWILFLTHMPLTHCAQPQWPVIQWMTNLCSPLWSCYYSWMTDATSLTCPLDLPFSDLCWPGGIPGGRSVEMPLPVSSLTWFVYGLTWKMMPLPSPAVLFCSHLSTCCGNWCNWPLFLEILSLLFLPAQECNWPAIVLGKERGRKSAWGVYACFFCLHGGGGSGGYACIIILPTGRREGDQMVCSSYGNCGKLSLCLPFHYVCPLCELPACLPAIIMPCHYTPTMPLWCLPCLGGDACSQFVVPFHSFPAFTWCLWFPTLFYAVGICDCVPVSFGSMACACILHLPVYLYSSMPDALYICAMMPPSVPLPTIPFFCLIFYIMCIVQNYHALFPNYKYYACVWLVEWLFIYPSVLVTCACAWLPWSCVMMQWCLLPVCNLFFYTLYLPQPSTMPSVPRVCIMCVVMHRGDKLPDDDYQTFLYFALLHTLLELHCISVMQCMCTLLLPYNSILCIPKILLLFYHYSHAKTLFLLLPLCFAFLLLVLWFFFSMMPVLEVVIYSFCIPIQWTPLCARWCSPFYCFWWSGNCSGGCIIPFFIICVLVYVYAPLPTDCVLPIPMGRGDLQLMTGGRKGNAMLMSPSTIAFVEVCWLTVYAHSVFFFYIYFMMMIFQNYYACILYSIPIPFYTSLIILCILGREIVCVQLFIIMPFIITPLLFCVIGEEIQQWGLGRGNSQVECLPACIYHACLPLPTYLLNVYVSIF